MSIQNKNVRDVMLGINNFPVVIENSILNLVKNARDALKESDTASPKI